MSQRTTVAQFWRFAAVGLASNAVLYGLYLLLTAWGLPPIPAMTLLYALGVIQTFVFNKQWTFRRSGAARQQFVRYCTAYALGYVVNLAALFFLVQVLGYPHQVAQGGLLLAIAVLLFLLQKFWIFGAAAPPSNAQVPAP